MKLNIGSLSTHIKGNVTTLARCWKVVTGRPEGVLSDVEVFGFTEHTRPITIDEITYLPYATNSNIKSTEGLEVNTIDTDSLMDFTIESDIESGKYENAFVEVFLVNYLDTSGGVMVLQRGTVGSVVRVDGGFSVKVRGLTDQLRPQFGRVYTTLCDAELGDSRCKVRLKESFVDTVDVTFHATEQAIVRDDGTNWEIEGFDVGDTIVVTGTVSNNATYVITEITEDTALVDIAVIDESGVTATITLNQDFVYTTVAITSVDANAPRRIFTVGALNRQTDGTLLPLDWFQQGIVTVETGPNADTKKNIREYDRNSGRVVLMLEMPFDLTTSDFVTMVVGCRKTFTDCQNKFDNVNNHRGFPHIPTTGAFFDVPVNSGTTTDFS